MWLGLSALAIAVLSTRLAYPKLLERRLRRRLPLDATGIVAGASTISLPRDGAPAALLIHGGGDTPQVLEGLARYLHERGFAVEVPLLAGHGRTLDAFARVSAEEWDEQIVLEYNRMRQHHEWVALVGLSMGGALAITVAARKHEIPALVLLSPYAAMPTFLRAVAATSVTWGHVLPYFSSRGGSSIRDAAAAARGLGSGIFTPGALRALRRVVATAERALPRVQSPTLMIQSRDDNRIAAHAAERIFASLGSAEKRLQWVDGAAHVITVDYGHKTVFELTAAWLRGHGGAKTQNKEGSVRR